VNATQKISVVLSTAEYNHFNSYCAEKGYKKSTLIERLIREHLNPEAYGVPDRGVVSYRGERLQPPHATPGE
jgi:hypothetical protein